MFFFFLLFFFQIFFLQENFWIDKILFGKTEIFHEIGLNSAAVAAKSKILAFV